MTFRGWPASVLDFYEGLEADNSRDYWLAHKQTYDDDVKAPFLEFGALVAKEFGSMRLFRPNRDIRFSKDKSPYKTQAAAATEGPKGTTYYVSISSEGMYVGSGYYHYASDQLERYRTAVAANRTGPRLAAEVAALRKKKYEVIAHDSLKRVPRGYDAEHPRAELLKQKGFATGRQFAPAKWMHTAAAADRIREVWRAAATVNRWLDTHVGPSRLPPPEPG